MPVDGALLYSCNKRPGTRIYDKIAEIVASTGETVNMADTASDSRFDLSSEKANGVHAKSLLCKPIRNPDFQIIGVAKVINRLDGKPFSELDDQLFEVISGTDQ
jgi:dual 3',5'-cyclic-AMP and -GMP phosphodiesterase 11